MTEENRRRTGRAISVAAIVCAVITGMLVLRETTENPRTDDAEVFANFIGVAPVVSGPIMKLNVADNQQVKQGDLLFDIDERPYAYALTRAKAEQASLEGEIVDEGRTIASQRSAVDVAQANTRSAEANVARAAASMNEAKAEVSHA
ncbi:MAG: biotin/lipoyl-binding protein, partial [Acidobacterium ailaaui]|nr:biotin/lipoyl-binding protein [Pseudacidobacterium ailaaui]